MNVRALGIALVGVLVVMAWTLAGPPAGGAPLGLSADDRAAIQNLAGRYSHALDLGDTAAWMEILGLSGFPNAILGPFGVFRE